MPTSRLSPMPMRVNSPTTSSTWPMKLPANSGNRATSSAAAPEIAPADVAPGRGSRLPKAVSIRCRLRSPQQHGERDHHEDDHRAAQREAAPGVEEVVHWLGDAAVGEDRPDQLLQHAGEPGGDEPAGQRSADAVAEQRGTARLRRRAQRPARRAQATPSQAGCWWKVSMASSGWSSATNTLRRSTRLITTGRSAGRIAASAPADRAGHESSDQRWPNRPRRATSRPAANSVRPSVA